MNGQWAFFVGGCWASTECKQKKRGFRHQPDNPDNKATGDPHYKYGEEAGIVPCKFWNRVGGDVGLLCVDRPEAYRGAG